MGKTPSRYAVASDSSSADTVSSRIREISVRISRVAGPVTSVFTAVETTNGPAPRRHSNAERAPYVNALRSRRLRLMRDENSPPRSAFITTSGK